jgi:hypothetical protein
MLDRFAVFFIEFLYIFVFYLDYFWIWGSWGIFVLGSSRYVNEDFWMDFFLNGDLDD